MIKEQVMAKHIGLRLRELRRQRGITQRQLADAVRIRHESISRIERGVMKAAPRTVSMLADYFGVSEEDLTGDKG
jgi:transcriptional regulator with XRE-family HTH domain